MTISLLFLLLLLFTQLSKVRLLLLLLLLFTRLSKVRLLLLLLKSKIVIAAIAIVYTVI